MIVFTAPTEHAVKLIAADMRQADAVEIMASHGHTPIDALRAGWAESSYSMIVNEDLMPIAMFGLVINSYVTGAGTPWLLATNRAMNHKREFLIQSPKVISRMLDICPRLSNHVHVENKTTIRWLRWLGFTIGDAVPVGVNAEMFHKFYIEKVIDPCVA